MAVIRASEAPTFTLPGVQFTSLTTPSRGAHEICTWHLHLAPKTPRGEAHWLDHEEVFVVISGALDVTINGDTETLQAGDAIAVPAQAHLQVSNSNAVPAHALVSIPVGFHATLASGEDVGTPPWAR